MNDQTAILRDDGPREGAKPLWAMSRREAEAWAIARAGLPPRRRRWPWVVLALVLLAAAAGVYAWQTRQAEAVTDAPAEEAAEPAPEGPATIQINRDERAVLDPRTLRRGVRVIGELVPIRRADLSSETSGPVETVLARPGDRVEQGAVLVQVGVERLTLDRDLAQSNADATRAQLALAEARRERARTLLDRGVATESALEEAESSVAGLEATLAALDDQVAAAELALEAATVRAPFDGIVESRSVDPGAVVSTGAALLSLVDLAQVEMRALVPVASGPLIQAGQAVEVSVDGVAGRTFDGEVARIAPVAEEGTRSLTVYVALDNADGTLLGGMFATGEIVVAEARDAIAVPTEAIREDDAGPHVMVIEDGVLARRDVTVGEAWAGDVTQVDGVAAGEVAVVVALPEIEAGQAVELVEF